MKKLNSSRSALIRSGMSDGDKCLAFAKYSGQVYTLLAKAEEATEGDVRVIENCLTNQINFLNGAIKHYEKARATTRALLKK